MKNPFNRQSQFELFPGSPGVQPKKSKGALFGASFTISLENIILGIVILIMAMVVAFSFGVEQGKRSAQKALTPPATETRPIISQEEKVTIAKKEDVSVSLPKKPVEVETDVSVVEKDEDIPVIEKKVDKTLTLEKIHTIQVASFKQQIRAETETKTLQKQGYDAFVAQKGTYTIVCVGKFPEKSMAGPLLKSLRKKYKDCYIRSL